MILHESVFIIQGITDELTERFWDYQDIGGKLWPTARILGDEYWLLHFPKCKNHHVQIFGKYSGWSNCGCGQNIKIAYYLENILTEAITGMDRTSR